MLARQWEIPIYNAGARWVLFQNNFLDLSMKLRQNGEMGGQSIVVPLL